MKPRRILSAARLSLPFASALVALFSAHSAQAQTTRYWDGNDSVANFGSASGTWAAPTTGTATAGWSASSAGTAVVLGNSVTTLINDPLNFGTDTSGRGLGTGTITVSGTVNAASLRFGSQTTGNITLSGGTINLAAVTSIHVGAGSTTVHTISSSITGAGTSLTKTGNSLTLSGANSYTGSTIISTGTLTLGSTGALGTNPGVAGTSGVTIGGAATATLSSTLTGITITAPITTASTGINSTISFGRSTAAAGSIALNGAIGGNGNVVFTTPNNNSGGNVQTVNLGATATYAGNTTITTGNANNSTTIRNSSGAANALPVSTVLNLNGGNGTGSGRTVTYDLNGQAQTLAGLTNSISALTARNQRVTNTGALATLTIDGSTDSTYGGLAIGSFFNGAAVNPSAQIVGAIALTKKGTGTFTLAAGAGNGFTGKTLVEGGILSLGHPTSIQSSAFDTAGSIAGDATNGLRATVATLTMAGLTGDKNLADVFTTTSGGYNGLTALTLNPGNGVTHSYDANIVDGATGMNLIKAGAGTQILTGINTYTGTTTGSAGVLLATKAAALSGHNVAGKVVFNGGTIGVQVGGSGWATGEVDTLLANATRTSGALGIDTTNGDLIQWAPFTTNFGSLGLNKLGANDLTLNQANTYTGTTTVTAGTLTLSNALALQNSPLNFSGSSVVLSGLTALNLGGLSGSGTLDLTGLTNLTLNAPAGALLNYSGIIADGTTGMTVTKTGPGAQALTGANTYTGATQIDGGILTFGNKAAKINTAATAAAAGTIGLGVKAADPAFYSEIEVGVLFNTNSLAGFSLDAASGVAIDTTNAGGSFDQTVALTAARSLSKTGTGTLVLSQANTYNGSTSVLQGTLSLTGSLDGGGVVSTSGSGVLSQTSTGVISGAATVTQGSTGASSLAGTNTYTGVTNVNLGQLTISNAAALGTIDGDTIVAAGGRLAVATASLSVAEPVTITGTGTTATNGALAFAGGVTGMALTGPITLGGAARIQADGSTGSTLSGGISLGANELTINTDGGATQTINTTAITGTDGSLVKSGGGTLVLGVANSYTGATTVNLGILSITDNGALGTTSVATTVNGGDGANAVSLSLTGATADLVVAEPLNFLGNTAGRAQLVNNSAQNHTLSGPINVSSDTNVPQFSSSGAGSITVAGDITGTFTNGASLFLRGASTSASNRVTGSLNLTGANLAKTDAGTWTVGALGETYSWTNTQLLAGTLKMGVAGVLPSSAILTMGNSTGDTTPTLDLGGFNQTVGGITYSGQGVATGTRTITSAMPATLTVNNATDFINTGTNVSINNVVLTGALSLTKQGAGTLELNGVNTYSGDTVVSDGTLALADNAQLKFVLGNASGDNNDLTGTGTVTLDGDFVIDTTAADALAAGTWTLENVSNAAYGSTFSVVGFTDAGGNKWTKANGPTVYTFDETTGILTLGTAGYSSWASTNGTLQTIDLDHDGDGVQNGVEYFLGGPSGNTTGFTPLPGVTNASGTLSVTWIKGSGYLGAYGTDFTVETSSTLTGVWATADPGTAAGQADTTTTPGQVKYTFPAGTRNFVRLKVTGP